MKHLRLFKTNTDYESATLDLPNLSYVEETDSVFYKPFIDYSKEYFTIETIDECTFQWNDIDCEYSLDNGNTWISQEAGKTFTISANNEIKFKATLSNDSVGSLKQYKLGKFNIKGNIMSLLYGDNFEGQTDLMDKDYIFTCLFRNCKVVDASNLVLPATKLTEFCYECMFQNCTLLTKAPKKLPATTLANYCYSNMFQKCTSLTTAPELPATTLAESCYSSMFSECTSLTTAPLLPAVTLETVCYDSMFYGCESLNEITMLATDISAYDCLWDWVNGVASSGTFIKHPDMKDLSIDTSGIPEGWTVVNAE